jgi:WXG100 family type VII secretion target
MSYYRVTPEELEAAAARISAHLATAESALQNAYREALGLTDSWDGAAQQGFIDDYTAVKSAQEKAQLAGDDMVARLRAAAIDYATAEQSASRRFAPR